VPPLEAPLDIWVTRQQDGRWTSAEIVPEPVSTAAAEVYPTVVADGNLVLQETYTPVIANIGGTVTFHLVATYNGTAPLSGASVYGAMPWPGGIANVVCAVQSASNCVVDTNSGNVHAVFDISPGGQVDISGQLKVLPWPDRAVLSAVVRGPTGLRELNTRDNFSSALIDRDLFANGFQ